MYSYFKKHSFFACILIKSMYIILIGLKKEMPFIGALGPIFGF